MDSKQELYEIITTAKSARKRLQDLIIRCEEKDEDISGLDEAADALSDAVEILEEVLGDSDSDK